MQVMSDWKLPIYQVIGPAVRVHWDYLETVINDDLEGPIVSWRAKEAVVQIDADRAIFVSIINAQGGNGDELANGWFNQKESSL